MSDRVAGSPGAPRRSAGTPGAPTRRSFGPVEIPYIRQGIRAGCLGAAVVALFFFVVDQVAGHPLATPNALGAALFLGRAVSHAAVIRLPIVLGYTAVHVAVFVAIASIVANLLLTASHLPASDGKLGLIVTAVLFVAFEVIFFAFTMVSDMSIWNELRVLHVGIANLLASGSMAFVLVRSARRERRVSETTRVAPGGIRHREA